MSAKKSLHGVDIVTASAGTGKTYRLTEMIEAETIEGRKPETILATTFTVKAAEELRERIRARLLEKGLAAQAVRLLGARIGTVNGVCGGLLGEFALGLGLSPVAEVISDDAQTKVFQQAADEAIARYASELDDLARRFGHFEGQERYDWRDGVNDIVARARANDMAPEKFSDFARRSAEGFARIAPKPLAGETEASLDAALEAAISGLLARYPNNEGLTAGTSRALDSLREIARAPKTSDISWPDWARLAKLKGTAAHDPHFEPVRNAASAFARHPRLIENVGRYITAVFDCAADAMKAYQNQKGKWGLVDFVDQERLALGLFTRPDLAPSLSERIESVYVDEFQDTSPLQLALFVALSQIAQASAWVGDPKQAIYGFRGADPELIARVAPKIQLAMGGDGQTLGKNYRSRPGLVDFANDAFGETFMAMGLPKKSVRVEEMDRADLPDQRTPLNVWHLQGTTIGARATALANGLMDRLARADEWRVAENGQSRPLAPGDIAILCATNNRCTELSNALASFGLKVALERDGLFGAPEVKLALAALRWCADQRDTLALAEMAHLLHAGDGQPEWFQASLEDGSHDALAALVPMAEELRAVARTSAHKSPAEFADAVLMAGGVADAVRRWGNGPDRMLNLEALRALIAGYEDECKQDRAPSTVTGLCAWLAEQEGKQPASRARDAITILTYHRAKGLEWPMVILTDLERGPRNNPFGLHVMSDRAAKDIDWRDPLADRWLRLWPWPFGAQKKDVDLDVRAQNSPEGQEAARIERDERARVLYVGATRARDYLVLALPPTNGGFAWLDELKSAAGGSAIVVPKAGATKMNVNGVEHGVHVETLAPADPPVVETLSHDYASHVETAPVFEPLALRPSDAAEDKTACIVEEIDLGARLPFAGSPDMAQVGEALHRFLAADDPTFPSDKRIALATRLLDAWGVTGLDPRDVVTMSDRFRAFIAKRWPNGVLRREAPITHRIDGRTLSGRIDAVIQTPDEIIVIDHKSFPGGRAQWQAQAEKYVGQLRLYGDALQAAGGRPKRVGLALHLPLSGELLMLAEKI
ncbi:UvrD-helicase domain-containing protein [Rhodoblastus sp.]|uniref:UvrD-helicase domain-containing protein n=1 Tax=Rhodoblastus sp. TaxID=1962975 RepID=UPI003F9461B6